MQFFAFFCCLCLTATRANALSHLPKVVVLSFSGFRAKFLENPSTAPFLKSWIQESAKPDFLIPVCPTKTSVNLLSVATGLYAEDHGVIDNCAIDEPPNQCKYEQYDERLNPIWIENQKQGNGISAVMMWPGSQREYLGEFPIHYKEYNNSIPSYKNRINKIIDWLNDKKEPANLVMAHFDDLEKVVRETEFDSNQTMNEIKKIDNIIKLFIEKLEKIDKNEDINLIILGSQGFCSIMYLGGKYLDDILTNDDCTITPMGANAIVTPKEGKFEYVYNSLKKHSRCYQYRVYKKDDIELDRLHLKKLPLFEKSIFLVAKSGNYFPNDYIRGVIEKRSLKISRYDSYFGLDGYSNKETCMHTFMAATGPRFRNRYRSEAFETIDIYPLLRELLGLADDTSEQQTEMKSAVRELLSSTALRPPRP